MLQDTQTEVCAICFSEDDKESTCNYIDWISCSQCLMWVHAARANNLSTMNTSIHIVQKRSTPT